MRKMMLAVVIAVSGLGMLLLFGTVVWLQWMPGDAKPLRELEFPMVVPDTELLVLLLTEYRGPFLEKPDSGLTVTSAAILVENGGGMFLSAGAVVLQRGQEQLVFEVRDLPPGEKVLVLEKDAQSYTGAAGWNCFGWTREEYPEDWGWVKTEQLSQGLAVTNTSDQWLPTVELTWKRRSDSAEAFVGGISFQCSLQALSPGETRILPLSHYEKDRIQVVKTIVHWED